MFLILSIDNRIRHKLNKSILIHKWVGSSKFNGSKYYTGYITLIVKKKLEPSAELDIRHDGDNVLKFKKNSTNDSGVIIQHFMVLGE